jgi:hypothetical protein
MADPSESDPTHPLPQTRGGAAQHREGERIALLALSVLLLVLGAGLAYASLTLRWAYYSGVPLTASDLSTLTPAQRPKMTLWWGDTMHGCGCGQLPVIWPAVVLLISLPLLVAAMRQHAVTRWWSRFGLLCAVCGFANVVVIAYGIGLAGALSDNGLIWSEDDRTVAIALSGYVLLFLGILVLTRATSRALASRSSTPSVGG